jgi:hypothetical protein
MNHRARVLVGKVFFVGLRLVSCETKSGERHFCELCHLKNHFYVKRLFNFERYSSSGSYLPHEMLSYLNYGTSTLTAVKSWALSTRPRHTPAGFWRYSVIDLLIILVIFHHPSPITEIQKMLLRGYSSNVEREIGHRSTTEILSTMNDIMQDNDRATKLV